MKMNRDKKIGEIVAENIKTAHVFKKNGIDFCCGGGCKIHDACDKKKISYIKLKKELLSVEKPKKEFDYNSWDLNFLIDHIVNSHHRYIVESIPLIKEYCKKVSKVHGFNHKEIFKIEISFSELAADLINHIKKEEIILFPYIRKLNDLNNDNNNSCYTPIFRSVINPIRMLEYEHKFAAQKIKEIKKITNDYSAPKGACNTFRALYSKLEEFDQDLVTHIHLENNILHIKAIDLERKLKYGSNQ